MDEAQTEQMMIKRLQASKRFKLGALLILTLLVSGGLLFQAAAGKIRQAATESLLRQMNEQVTGQIVVGEIDLSLLGRVRANDVQIVAVNGATLARIQRVQLRYDWKDLLKGQLGPQLIRGITLEKPEIWLVFRDTLNWDGLLKREGGKRESFCGTIKVEQGLVHWESEMLTTNLEEVNGALNVLEDQKLMIAVAGKGGQADVALNGQWTQLGATELILVAKGAELTALGLTKTNDPLQISAGRLDEVSVTLGCAAPSDKLELRTIVGRFSGVSTTGVLQLTDGSAVFEKQGSAMLFRDGRALYQGQTVTAEGQVNDAAAANPSLDFAVQLPAADPAALLPGVQAGGSLAATGRVSGAATAPQLAGSFTLGSLQFGDLTIGDIQGDFSYAQQTLQLHRAVGSLCGGTLTAGGLIVPATQQYDLTISGDGLNSAQLAKKDVSGPLSLSGTAVGRSDAATVQGQFAVYDGKAYGIPFRSITGTFVKRGAAEVEVGNLAIKTAFGVFYPEQLSQLAMTSLQERQLPTNGGELKEQAVNALKEKAAEKILEKLFH